MTEQESANRFVELAKINAQSIEKRKSVEWKVAFGFWFGIAVFTWFISQRQFVNPEAARTWLGIVLAAALAIWVLAWQFPLHRAFIEDQNWRNYYKAMAAGEGATKPAAKGVSYWEPFKYAWIWGQGLMTALFLILAYFVVFSTLAPASSDSSDVIRVSGENLRVLLDKLPGSPPTASP